MRIDAGVNSRCCNRLRVSRQKLASFCLETAKTRVVGGFRAGQRESIVEQHRVKRAQKADVVGGNPRVRRHVTIGSRQREKEKAMPREREVFSCCRGG